MPLASFVSCNLCVTGLELILAGVSLDEAAWRLGYQAGDGLANRIQHIFSRKPREFAHSDLPGLWQYAASLVPGPKQQIET